MSFFVLISTRRFTCWKNFCAGVFVFESGASDEKSCPEPLGRNPVARVWMAQVEVCRESCRRRSVLEQRNATSLNVHPVCWNGVAWSIPPPHLHHHHHHHHHHHPPSSSSSPTVKTAAALLRAREDKKKPPKPTLFFLCSSRSPARTFSFSTHSLTHSLRVLSQPPFLWRGVVFRSPPATRGRPRWPTEGGRGRETQRPLVAEDRLWCRKFALHLSPTSELRGHFRQNAVVSWTSLV